MRDIVAAGEVLDKWWEDGGSADGGQEVVDAAPAAVAPEVSDYPDEAPPPPPDSGFGFDSPEEAPPMVAADPPPGTGTANWTPEDVERFTKGFLPGEKTLKDTGGFRQPSIDQIQAETDTLNGDAPEPYDPVFGSFSRGEVKDALTSYGWDPAKAEQFADKFNVTMDDSPEAKTRGGAFWPGEGRVTFTPFSDKPEERAPFTMEHEMHHAADYNGWERDAGSTPRLSSPTGPAAGSFREQNIAMAQQRDLTRLAEDGNYPEAAQVAQSLLDDPKIMADRAHINHYLIDRLDFDYSALPPDFVHKYFPYAGSGGGVPVARAKEITGRNNATNDRLEENRATFRNDGTPEIADKYDALENNRARHLDAESEATRNAYWEEQIRRVPWWMDITQPADLVERGPPPVAGPYDKAGDERFYDEDGRISPFGRMMMGTR